jgi:hypothetical protein
VSKGRLEKLEGRPAGLLERLAGEKQKEDLEEEVGLIAHLAQHSMLFLLQAS